ncbi:MAG: hypothetical protein AB9869_09730 [Verrucomicrobiia bacterium]
MRLDELAIKFCWWWRTPTAAYKYDHEYHSLDFAPLSDERKCLDSRCVDRRWEFAAWHYELLRRHEAFTDWPPFNELDPDGAQHAWKGYFGDYSAEPETARIYLDETDGFSHDHHGWAQFPDVEWNLRAADNALSEQFIKFIHEERKAQKIVAAKGLTGRRNRPVSWLWPELLDRRDKARESLNRSEKELYSKAKRLSCTLASHCLREAREDSHFTPEPEKLGRVEALLASRLKLARLRRAKGE